MKSPSFQFYPKQWLGDDNVLLMDWAARGMHVHLMCIAWQQDPPCTLPDDDSVIRKWCGNPKQWSKLRLQILRSWKRVGGRWVQEGLLREFEKQQNYSDSRRQAAEARWKKDDAYASGTHSIRNALLLQSSSSLKIKDTDMRKRASVPVDLNGARTGFEIFWKAYPRKRNKPAAEKSWQELKPDDVLLGVMLSKVYLAKQTQQWTEKKGKYIPYPASWLNANGWEDEYEIEKRHRSARIPL
jgi:uncharacterized protein YdaU (DUF1376 family)